MRGEIEENATQFSIIESAYNLGLVTRYTRVCFFYCLLLLQCNRNYASHPQREVGVSLGRTRPIEMQTFGGYAMPGDDWL